MNRGCPEKAGRAGGLTQNDAPVMNSLIPTGITIHKGGSVSEKKAIFTERELDVMDILWTHGSGTVLEVKESIEDELAYTTVLTVLRTLEQKGYITHEMDGRAYRYLPLVERTEARRNHLDRLMGNLFGGSPELLVTQLVSDRDLSKDELKRLRKVLDDRLS